MFFSPFYKDPVKDAIVNVMKKNQTIRETEKGLLNDLKIQSEKQIPHELLSEYNSVLAKRTNAALNEDCIDTNAVDKDKDYKEDETQETDMGDRKRTSREKAKQLLAGIVKKKLNEAEKNEKGEWTVSNDKIDSFINKHFGKTAQQKADRFLDIPSDKKGNAKHWKPLGGKPGTLLGRKKKVSEGVSLDSAREKWAKKMEAHGWLKTGKEAHAIKQEKRAAGLERAKDNWAKEMEKTSPDEIKQKVSLSKRIKDNFRRSMEDVKRKPKTDVDRQAASDKAGVKKVKAGFAKAMAEQYINEISKGKLADYVEKAKGSIKDLRKKRFAALDKGDSSEHGRLYDKQRQRMNSQRKAESKVDEAGPLADLPQRLRDIGKYPSAAAAAQNLAKHYDPPPKDYGNLVHSVDTSKIKPTADYNPIKPVTPVKSSLPHPISKPTPDFSIADKPNKPLTPTPASDAAEKAASGATHASAAPSMVGQDLASRLKTLASKPADSRDTGGPGHVTGSEPKKVATRGIELPAKPAAPAAEPAKPADSTPPLPRSRPPQTGDDNSNDSFNTAFGKARRAQIAKAGAANADKGTFTWKGKTYSTKRKGGLKGDPALG